MLEGLSCNERPLGGRKKKEKASGCGQMLALFPRLRRSRQWMTQPAVQQRVTVTLNVMRTAPPDLVGNRRYIVSNCTARDSTEGRQSPYLRSIFLICVSCSRDGHTDNECAEHPPSSRRHHFHIPSSQLRPSQTCARHLDMPMAHRCPCLASKQHISGRVCRHARHRSLYINPPNDELPSHF